MWTYYKFWYLWTKEEEGESVSESEREWEITVTIVNIYHGHLYKFVSFELLSGNDSSIQ